VKKLQLTIKKQLATLVASRALQIFTIPGSLTSNQLRGCNNNGNYPW